MNGIITIGKIPHGLYLLFYSLKPAPMSNYFSHPFVSNSKLSALKQELSGADAIEYKDAYRMGTLVDAMITEPSVIDVYRAMVGVYTYSAQEIQLAQRMKAAFMNHPLGSQLLKSCKTQKEFYVPNVDFTWNDIPFQLNCKCKYDFFNPLTGWGADLKSTVATSQAAFESSISLFDYDRQAYFYMKLSGSKRFPIIGVSKKKDNPVFHKLITAGDDLWQSGKIKCDELAFKYWALKPHQTAAQTN